MITAKHSRLARRQRGVSLIETMVASLLVSLGLLGLASLQTLSLGRSSSSTWRTEALQQSSDLLDRMRSNRAQALGGHYDLAFATAPDGSTQADVDLAAWKAALGAALPEGDGQVRIEAQVVTISIRWRDAADTDGLGAVHLRSRL